MKKRKSEKKFLSILLSLSLISTILISNFPASFVYAKNNIFIGIDDVEVEENTPFDLMKGVSAQNQNGEKLQVSISSVLYENNETAQYDNFNTLSVGSAGTTYIVNYKAASSDNSEEYTASRKIISIQREKAEKKDESENKDNSDINAEESLKNTESKNDESESKDTPDVNVVQALQITTLENLSKIYYENGIYYIKDPEYPNEQFIIYCMNNELKWPNGDGVPDYKDGYLTPDDFKSEEDYKECMRRLAKILYAGYPYNGSKLYEIVSEPYVPTVEEFNKMLIPLSSLKTAFPELGDYEFTYQDWVTNNQEHLNVLLSFIRKVFQLNLSGGKTSNGLTYSDITSMQFYRAAYCMVYGSDVTPLEVYSELYSTSYFVTDEQAYLATQNAVWVLLNEYGIKDNNLKDTALNQYNLARVLYDYSKDEGWLLDYKPTVDKIKLEGDLKFSYNPNDGMWHSGKLKIKEPAEYHGIYKLTLPTGVTAICDNSTYVYGDEEFELVSADQPKGNEIFKIEADFTWLKKLKQYTPSPDVVVDGKKFQHMIGAVIRNEKLSAQAYLSSYDVGSLEIKKTVLKDNDDKKEFNFQIKFPDNQISGKYGDLNFDKGIANFTLKNGETISTKNLPAGAKYIVTEIDTGEYQIGSINSEGTITANQNINVEFTNTKLPNLLISKTVTGEAGDKTKKFTFEINIQNADGSKLNGNYNYLGSVKKGYENESTEPENGTLTFSGGKSKITLSHGQQITIKNLPLNCTYIVVEKEANQDGYTTTYNEKSEQATGALGENSEVNVVNNKEFVPDTGITNNNNHNIGVGIAISIAGILLIITSYLLRLRKG
ncbi:DUF7601 domain-containing protein [Clostridium perfringens]|uniref:DUF7601 domain-containing protein n=1 Tax=Clostridium perfringens TaxID=1502 RepID=UPI003F90AFA8